MPHLILLDSQNFDALFSQKYKQEGNEFTEQAFPPAVKGGII